MLQHPVAISLKDVTIEYSQLNKDATMSYSQLENIWLNFINAVNKIDCSASTQINRKYRKTFFLFPNKFAHADPAEILRRLFSWGDAGTVTRRSWENIYIALGGTQICRSADVPGC